MIGSSSVVKIGEVDVNGSEWKAFVRLKDRIAWLTGGAGGIGEAIARLFAENGARVAITDLDSGGAARVARDIVEDGGAAWSAQLDVTDQDAVEDVASTIVKKHGRIDILVNIAGVGSSVSFTEITLEEFERVMRINVTGSLICAQVAARQMIKRNYGRIINLASISGARAGELRTGYGTSKAAVIGLTRQGARELGAYGITVNAIGPGPVDTPLSREFHSDVTRANYNRMIPMGRYGTVDEMADAALFLAGEAAGYVNGQTLFVDGGYISAGVGEAK